MDDGFQRDDDALSRERIAEIPEEVFTLPPSADALREDVFRRSSAVLRVVRWRRRVGVGLGWAAVYMFGLVSGGLLGGGIFSGGIFSDGRVGDRGGLGRSDDQPIARVSPELPDEILLMASSDPTVPLSEDREGLEDSVNEESPAMLEERSRREPLDQRIRSLRRAGDLYLSDVHDVVGALRCYRQMITLLPAQNRSKFDSSDNWLVVALKSEFRGS